MPFPNFIDIGDPADISLGSSVNLLLASVAFEEFALANLINAEAEKIQYMLGTLDGQNPPDPPSTPDQILEVNQCADQTLRDVIKKEVLLQLKLENILSLSSDAATTASNTKISASTDEANTAPEEAAASTATITTTSTSSTSTTTTSVAIISTAASATLSAAERTHRPPCGKSAWVAGTDFGSGCAQYTTLELGELCKAADLNLACKRVPVGTVRMVRCGTDLLVTIATARPHVMDRVYLYVGLVPPTDSNPENFPYRYAVTDPSDYFRVHTFDVDVRAYLGRTIYISAYARLVN